MASRAGALLMLALALAGGWLALGYGLSDFGQPGSGLFPALACAALGVLALPLLWRGDTLAREPVAWGKLSGYVVAAGGYALALEPLGHLLASALVLGFVMLVLERLRWPLALGVTAASVAGAWALFERLLQMPLPRGPF